MMSFKKKSKTKKINIKILCIIQARISSSRLPAKVFLTIFKDKSLLKMLYEKSLPSKNIDKIIIATSTNE